MANESAAKWAEDLQRESAILKKYRFVLVPFVMIALLLMFIVAPYYNRTDNHIFGFAGIFMAACGGLVGFVIRLVRLTLAQQREIEELKSRLTALEKRTV